MKNVIHIIVDACCFDSLKRKVGNREVMPFLNALSKESVSFDRMFSQAPYTEASLITLLSGENTLDNGGYLFGNATVENTIFSKYRQAGYKTVFTYSPYVYSKAYLRDVDEYQYTRLVSVEPLFLYRLRYYRDIYLQRKLSCEEMQVCAILLEEVVETWKEQCESILSDSEKMALIYDWVKDRAFVAQVSAMLDEELQKLQHDPEAYVREVFELWDEHPLRTANRRYRARTELKLRQKTIDAFQNVLDGYQKVYTNVLKKHKLDIAYVAEMAFRNVNGITDAKETVSAYRRHWANTNLRDYLASIDENAKTEVAINRIFEVYERILCDLDGKDERFYAHIHAQDFHLPSVFHSVDTDDFALLQDEFAVAFELLDGMDSNYRGNIVADLSARYCDRKIELFYQKLKSVLKKDFVFTVTADHGFPSYETPPRPMVYNQTYTEAFHVPCIIHDGIHCAEHAGIYSNMDAIGFEMQCAGVEQEKMIPERKHVVCEYGGPGCPDIGVKPIWYTYIDDRWRISAECALTQDFTTDCIKDIYDIQNDPSERKNLVKYMRNSKKVIHCCEEIGTRHHTLKVRFSGEKFLKAQLDAIAFKS